MKIHKVVATSVLATSLMFCSLTAFAQTAEPSLKAALALSKIGSDPKGNEALRHLLHDEGFSLLVLSLPSEGSNFGILQDLVNDKSNPLRSRELQSLLTVQAQALENSKGNTKLHATLSQLFVKQLDLIVNCKFHGEGATEISGLLQIDEKIMNTPDSANIQALADSEIHNIELAMNANNSWHQRALNEVIFDRSKLTDSKRLLGSVALEYVMAQTESGKQATLEILNEAIGAEKSQEVVKTLSAISSNIAGRAEAERKQFLMQLENDPVFVTKVISGLGTGVLGVVTGSPILVLSGVWGVVGSRIMAHVPINSMLLTLAEGSTDLVKLASTEEREAALARMKHRIGETSEVVVEKVISCGKTVGSKCDEMLKSNDTKQAVAQAEVVVHSLIDKGGQTLGAVSNKLQTAINSPEAAELASKASAWGNLVAAQASGGAAKCWSALTKK